MFRRKDEDVPSTPEAANDLLSAVDDDAIDTSPAQPSPEEKKMTDSTTTAPAAATATTSAPSFRPQPAPNLAQNRAPAAAAAAASSGANVASAKSNIKASKRILTVGNDIHMKGEIATCDRLVIEGSVDAELKDVHTVELAETGSFKGTAEIEDAEISGSFEGDLIVNGRLIIYSTGRVSGNIAYGEIEIERGGQLSGNIKTTDQIKTSSGKATDKKVA